MACGWTDPDFVPPLLALLDGVPEYRLQAAACLIRYQKADLDRRVAIHSKYEQDLGGGCLPYVLSVQRLVDDYKRTQMVDSSLRPANVDANLISLQNGDPPTKVKAWTVLAHHDWFAPWQEYGLTATDIWDACDNGDSLSRPMVGFDRAKQFLAHVRRTSTLEPAELDRITTLGWILGCREEGPACRAILNSVVTKFAEDRNPPYKECAALYALCRHPDPANLDLFRRLIGRPSSDLRSRGWQGIVLTDREESFQILDACWKEPGEQILSDAYYLFSAIGELGRRNTPNRDRWLDWLLGVRAKVPADAPGLPSWIDAMASMAGRDFGFNGQYIPSGFSKEKAQKTVDSILEWNANGRRR